MKGAVSIYKVTNNNEYINIVKVDAPQHEGISAKDLKRWYKENFNVLEALGSTLEKIEVKTMPYGDVVYVELTEKLTHESKDSYLKSGLIIQETADLISGTDVYQDISAGSVVIFYIKDKDVYMISVASVGGKVSDIDNEAIFIAENITFN